mmetsp:Transcript_28265/g.72065  ORF Transcript_28265/g.72065 Transcript_28265/m.72065 type:complete len:378 (-) Transcript_28265:111-1244(-)
MPSSRHSALRRPCAPTVATASWRLRKPRASSSSRVNSARPCGNAGAAASRPATMASASAFSTPMLPTSWRSLATSLMARWMCTNACSTGYTGGGTRPLSSARLAAAAGRPSSLSSRYARVERPSVSGSVRMMRPCGHLVRASSSGTAASDLTRLPRHTYTMASATRCTAAQSVGPSTTTICSSLMRLRPVGRRMSRRPRPGARAIRSSIVKLPPAEPSACCGCCCCPGRAPVTLMSTAVLAGTAALARLAGVVRVPPPAAAAPPADQESFHDAAPALPAVALRVLLPCAAGVVACWGALCGATEPCVDVPATRARSCLRTSSVCTVSGAMPLTAAAPARAAGSGCEDGAGAAGRAGAGLGLRVTLLPLCSSSTTRFA